MLRYSNSNLFPIIFLWIIGDALRRLEPTPNVSNTLGYTRINGGADESDLENPSSNRRNNANENAANETTYFTNAGPELAGSVEQLFRILLEYAGVKLSVTSSIEPLFDKLGQTVLASAQIKRFDAKILPNESINDSQIPPVNPSLESSVLSVTNLNIHSVCRQSLEHDQLHSANVQAGIRVQRVKQEVNLSLLRLVYQFSTVFGNAVEYTGVDEIVPTEPHPLYQQADFSATHSRTTTFYGQPESGIENLVINSLSSDLFQPSNSDNFIDLERPCWKKLRELVAIYRTPPEIKQIAKARKPPTEPIPGSAKLVQTQNKDGLTNSVTDTLLLSAFGWLIIDEIYYAASLGGLKVDGCMRKVQGSISLSQKLRALQANTAQQNAKK